MNPPNQAWMLVTGWTLIHFIWQGGLLAVVTAAGLRLCRRHSSTTRYAIACVGLTAMLAAPVVTAAVLREPASVSLPAASGSRRDPGVVSPSPRWAHHARRLDASSEWRLRLSPRSRPVAAACRLDVDCRRRSCSWRDLPEGHGASIVSAWRHAPKRCRRGRRPANGLPPGFDWTSRSGSWNRDSWILRASWGSCGR